MNTLFDKIWTKHIVTQIPDGPSVLYIDQHLIHEVTSPVAFLGLKNRGIKVFRPRQVFATVDHNVPTIDQHLPIKDELSRNQIDTLIHNCKEHNIELYGLNHPYQGIVHVTGPESGITQPGRTIVCGDSHTSTHGAFGCIAFGIGTSEVEMVLATQCLLQSKPKQMRITVNGDLEKGVTSKDIILYIISKLTSGGASGYFIEFAGDAIRNLSMEARMTLCNMSIEMGARGGLIAPDEITYDYLKNRLFVTNSQWNEKITEWKFLFTDSDAVFDKEYTFDAKDIEPMVTYGTNPGMGIKINGKIPEFYEIEESGKTSFGKSLEYMNFNAGEKICNTPVNYVFIGSCTNGRMEDLRLAAKMLKGRKAAPNIRAYVVPGSKVVEKQAKEEGLIDIFEQAGVQFRQPGCSACLAMNDDKVPAGEYCVSTSNRNFEGRQGPGARTILASVLTATATIITGKISDPREFL